MRGRELQDTELDNRGLTPARSLPFIDVGDTFCEKWTRPGTPPWDPRLLRVQSYVERNLHRKISLTDAARTAGLEKHYFSAYFRRSTGITFSGWVREVRARRALSLICSRRRTLLRIALEVGYRDLSGLERAFRAVLGMSPRECLRAARRTLTTAKVLPIASPKQ